ncbi:hypothetical protein NDU88_008335 [Pleurodeles waltl]|uniref:Uncharacterized protein n=1 Tax=Pleurodeles waltl TaxID=8319 RepID=A0AAV7RVH6_PLEWA|nr:hypothetical protein NDU88_008335 [Pleurodeles waltl]
MLTSTEGRMKERAMQDVCEYVNELELDYQEGSDELEDSEVHFDVEECQKVAVVVLQKSSANDGGTQGQWKQSDMRTI